MSREENVNYKQDRLGNERKELDELRAQEGMVEGTETEDGITQVQTQDTGSLNLIYEKPEHANEAILSFIHAYNSLSTSGSTFSLYEVETDDNGSITSQTRRTVPLNVTQGSTRTIGYEGLPFEEDIAIESEFGGYVGVAVISDNDRSADEAYRGE